jgi:argininosuccinate lyase
VRATAGDAVGDLTGLLTTLKGLPRAYNRDLQRATPHVWDAVDAVREATDVCAGAVATATWPEARLREAAGEGFSTATGVADLLAQAGIPFRTAHEVVAAASREGGSVEALETASREVLGASLFEHVDRATVEAVLDPAESVRRRNSRGGPAPAATTHTIERGAAALGADTEALAARREAIERSERERLSEVDQYV